MRLSEIVLPTSEGLAPNRRVLRRRGLERAALEITGEDDVDDVLRGEAAHRRNRIDDRHGPLDRDLVGDPHLLGKLAMKGPDEAFARIDSAAWEEPVLAPGLLVWRLGRAYLAVDDGHYVPASPVPHGGDRQHP